MSRLILFDGVCHLCAGWVRFVIARDPHRRFQFAPLQSRAAREYLPAEASALPEETDGSRASIVLVDEDGVFTRSDAVLRIGRGLTSPWPFWSRLAGWWPRSLRDAIYGTVARRRYRWFGREDRCIVPDPQVRERFLAIDENPPAR